MAMLPSGAGLGVSGIPYESTHFMVLCGTFILAYLKNWKGRNIYAGL